MNSGKLFFLFVDNIIYLFALVSQYIRNLNLFMTRRQREYEHSNLFKSKTIPITAHLVDSCLYFANIGI